MPIHIVLVHSSHVRRESFMFCKNCVCSKIYLYIVCMQYRYVCRIIYGCISYKIYKENIILSIYYEKHLLCSIINIYIYYMSIHLYL